MKQLLLIIMGLLLAGMVGCGSEDGGETAVSLQGPAFVLFYTDN